MVVKRGRDGNIVDDSTEEGTVELTDRGSTLGSPKTGGGSTADSGGRSLGANYDTPTVQATGSGLTSIPAAGGGGSGSRSLPDDADATRIVGRLGDQPAASESVDSGPAPAPQAQRTSAADDPPVGWLVVIDGPGRGETLQLGHGRNPIGRGADVRVRADFGDEEISRSTHAAVTYDPKSRRFFLNHGEGTNLTYLDDNPVLQPVQLTGNEHITLGATTFRFVAFCGTDFDWT